MQFYVLNPTIENTARDILLLSVALESSDILGLRGKFALGKENGAHPMDVNNP